MRKVFPLLALIAFACDISRDVLVHGDPARKPEAAGRSGDYEYQTESREHADDAEVPQSSAETREQTSESLVGKWRSNGEALEPKWRDGDSVPLLPFSHYARDEVEDVEQEDLPETTTTTTTTTTRRRRPFKYHYAIDQPDRPRGSSSKRFPSPEDYDHEASYRSRDHETPDEDYPRKRRRPLKNLPSPTLYEETIDSAASNDGKRGRNNVVDSSLNDREVTWRYREAFQARPNDYEHEFSDEEYLRPRPRKRRPPQNYEFALANEASPNDENEESRNTPPRHPPKDDENPPTESSEERENALELKSLLKMQQEEGSSLSEILQRRNLTLSDLLKGRADVINALKSRIADESDEYIEEMSRVMSNSLMKLAVTVTPPSGSTPSSAPFESTTIRATTSDTIADSSVPQMTIATGETKSLEKISANDTNRVKEESVDAEKMTQSAPHESSWLRAPTTPLTLSTITTSTSSSPPPIAVNSAEYFLNDDGNAELTSDRATRLESLDEDEIMEFSDFTDFKRGKSPPSEGVISQQAPRDTESTLSIEQILNPTERIKPAESRESNQDNVTGSNDDREMIRDNGRSAPIGLPTVVDYDTFIEAEYQNDTPKTLQDDGKQSEMNDHPSTIDEIEKKQPANPADDRKELRDKNHSAEYHQVTRSPGERTRDRTLENHRNAKPYEEAVSEIEPEARAEIFELFASGSAGKRLERLLKSRNMSLEELIALRQRGSSKVHLTEVSRLRMSKSRNRQTLETSNTNNEEIPLSSASDSNKHFNEDKVSGKEDARQAAVETMNQFKDIMSYLHNPFFDKDGENMSMSRLLDLVERDKAAPRETTHPENDTLNTDERTDELENSRRTVQIVDLLTTFGFLPFAKNAQRQFKTEIDGNERELRAKFPINNDNASVVVIDEKKTLQSDNTSEFHAGYVEEIVKEEPNVIDIKTAVYGETIGNTNDGEEKKTLSKVKPSIIASGAILGVTIVVFLAIFVVCRIRQKQKYTYRNTFSRAVFQGPVMAARKLSNSSSLNAVMVNVVATSTTKRPERTETQETVDDFDSKSDMENDSLDANDSWETIPDYAK